ncbi:glycosyl hydrolase catalytic core-domain-containing protein [Cyathus striatus]|nr:glycosyl hydrolase catalytic core-domain-containing protein [Cyathus striatus]
MTRTTMLTTLYFWLLASFPSGCARTLVYPRDDSNMSKAGLAWANADSIDIKQYETDKVSWYYTWSSYPTSTDLEFVPMLWGSKNVDQFSSTIDQTLSSGNVKAVLGMNEPEQTGQSNMSPQDGANMWKTYLEPLKAKGVRLGSPAPSSAPAGKTWLQDFLTACNGGCSVNFIALHWYGTNATQFQLYIADYHDTFQLPLWITEWACQNYVDASEQCSEDDVVLFLNATQTYMDSQDWVERYAWFGAMKDMQGVNADNALMDSNGAINALGKQYVGDAAPQTDGGGSAQGPGGPQGGGGAPSNGTGGGNPIVVSAAQESRMHFRHIGLVACMLIGMML